MLDMDEYRKKVEELRQMAYANKLDLIPSENWKVNDNAEIGKIYDEVWDEATRLGYTDKVEKPRLYLYHNTKSFGMTVQDRKDLSRAVIAVNRVFLNDPKLATETIVHEIAHATVNSHEASYHNHDDVWTKYGNAIGKKFGVTVKEKGTPNDLGLKPEMYPYHMGCPKCGTMVNFTYAAKMWKNAESYNCNACGEPIAKIRLDTDEATAARIGAKWIK